MIIFDNCTISSDYNNLFVKAHVTPEEAKKGIGIKSVIVNKMDKDFKYWSQTEPKDDTYTIAKWENDSYIWAIKDKEGNTLLTFDSFNNSDIIESTDEIDVKDLWEATADYTAQHFPSTIGFKIPIAEMNPDYIMLANVENADDIGIVPNSPYNIFDNEYNMILSLDRFNTADYLVLEKKTDNQIEAVLPNSTGDYANGLYIVWATQTETLNDGKCGNDVINYYTVVYNNQLLFDKGYPLLKELSDNCNTPQGLLDYLMHYNAFNMAINTDNLPDAITYYNELIGINPNVTISKGGCCCHG